MTLPRASTNWPQLQRLDAAPSSSSPPPLIRPRFPATLRHLALLCNWERGNGARANVSQAQLGTGLRNLSAQPSSGPSHGALRNLPLDPVTVPCATFPWTQSRCPAQPSSGPNLRWSDDELAVKPSWSACCQAQLLLLLLLLLALLLLLVLVLALLLLLVLALLLSLLLVQALLLGLN